MFASKNHSSGAYQPDVALTQLKNRFGVEEKKLKVKVEEGGPAVPVAKVEEGETPIVKSEETAVKQEPIVKDEPTVKEESDSMSDISDDKEEEQESKEADKEKPTAAAPEPVKWIKTDIFDEDGVKLEWGRTCDDLLHIYSGRSYNHNSYQRIPLTQGCEWLKIDDNDVVQSK